MSLGRRIELLRIQRGMSQAELARRAGMHQSTMNSLINGNSRTSRSLLALARELQTTPAFLIGETDDPSIDAVDLVLDSQDREALELLNALEPENRKAIMQIMRTMAHSARVPGVQSPKSKFTGPTEAQLQIKPNASTAT